jgi:hypothetical protein
MKFIHDVRLLFGVSFVDGEKERSIRLAQKAHEFEIRRGDIRTPVHHHHDCGGFIECDSRLAKDFRWNEIFVLGNNPAGVNDANVAAAPFGVSVEAVARDAGFVTDDGATRPYDAVEQCGLAYVGPAHDGERGNSGGGSGESAGRVVSGLSQNKSCVERGSFGHGVCHPEQREGPWFLPAPFHLPPQANTKIPSSARDDRASPMRIALNLYYRDSRGFKFSTRVSRIARPSRAQG